MGRKCQKQKKVKTNSASTCRIRVFSILRTRRSPFQAVSPHRFLSNEGTDPGAEFSSNPELRPPEDTIAMARMSESCFCYLTVSNAIELSKMFTWETSRPSVRIKKRSSTIFLLDCALTPAKVVSRGAAIVDISSPNAYV